MAGETIALNAKQFFRDMTAAISLQKRNGGSEISSQTNDHDLKLTKKMGPTETEI